MRKVARSVWLGRALSALVVVVLAADAAVALFAPQIESGLMEEGGWPLSEAPLLGIIMAVCALLYAVPRTATIGAILGTAFFGGAVATHVRIGQHATPPLIFCILAIVAIWGGLYLRDRRYRALLPLRD